VSAAGVARLSDLSRAVEERGEVMAVERLGGGLVEITARLPVIAARVRPGEFAQLRCGEPPVPLLRRPFSVARVDGELCSFVLEAVGDGTRRLCALRGGERLQALGPLGVGFTLPAAGRVVCVAGGLGCAPFPLAARRALEAGATEVVVLHGAASAARLYPAERFTRGDARVRVVEATDDGSRGHHGRVTDLVAAELAAPVAALWACGPNPMLDTLAALLDAPGGARGPRGARSAPPPIVEASLEAPMGCGIGTCLGCALPVREGADGRRFALCCREGPVMPMGDVDWQALRALPPPQVA
jgi:dihydroorotate dehydrogenase electron transfer subunit